VIEKIKQESEHIKEEVISLRRHFHKYPERSLEEFETAKFIENKLKEYEIPYRSGIAKTGILAVIEGEKEGGTVALRADMDALPVHEETALPFASKNEGAMHACGHDAHMAILLGTGKILSKNKSQIKGRVLLVFQPSEEKSPVGGAKPMLDDGVFDDYQPDVIYGLHVWPDLPVGQFGIRDAEMMGASDSFSITIAGTGGHASMPQTTRDPILTAAHLIVNLQSIVSRSLDPLQASVVTTSMIHGGSARNIIPNEVKLEGSIRTYQKEIKDKLKERFFEIAEGVAEVYQNDIQIEYNDGYPATINTPKWAKLARESVVELFGKKATPEVKPSLAAEDFSRFLEEIDGAFIWLGSMNEDEDMRKGLHDASFTVNEEALTYGVAYSTYVAIKALEQIDHES